MEAFIAKREAETGRDQPHVHQPQLAREPELERPVPQSSQQAYDGLYIGSVQQAVSLQQKK